MVVEKRAKMRLVGLDGNAFALMGAFAKAARRSGWTPDEIAAVRGEMMSGDYGNLLRVLMHYTDDRDD